MDLQFKLMKIRIWLMLNSGFKADFFTHPYYKILSKTKQDDLAYHVFGRCNEVFREVGIKEFAP